MPRNSIRVSRCQTPNTLLALAFLLAGCSITKTSDSPASLSPPESIGTFGVGNVTIELNDSQRSRTFKVEIWYPATTSTNVVPEPSGFESDEADRQQLA